MRSYDVDTYKHVRRGNGHITLDCDSVPDEIVQWAIANVNGCDTPEDVEIEIYYHFNIIEMGEDGHRWEEDEREITDVFVSGDFLPQHLADKYESHFMGYVNDEQL